MRVGSHPSRCEHATISLTVALVAALTWPTALVALPTPDRVTLAKHEEPPPGPRPDEPPVQGYTPCVDGHAGDYPCHGVDLLSFLPISAMGGTAGLTTGNDVWGWTDPDSGREYALMGLSNGVSFVDISDPRRPVWLGRLPTAAVDSVWRGIKVYRNYAFIVADRNPGHGMQVFDLRRLRDVLPGEPQTFTADARYTAVGSVHNMVLDEETGFGYLPGSDTCAGGLHIVDLRDPLHPTQAGCFAADGYTHDAQCVVYRGPDARYVEHEVCFASNEDTLTLVDVTDKAAPRMISRTTYVGASYTHQGWLTENQQYFLLDDEFDEMELHHNSRTYVWDVRDLEHPQQFAAYTGPAAAIDHNQYIRGHRDFQANYRSGARVLDIRQVAAGNLREEGFFDIVPVDDSAQFNGAWNIYPFFPSGTFIVSGIEQGLYVLGLASERVAVPATCVSGPQTLCLQDGRFQVTAHWRNQFDGRHGQATAIPGSDFAGNFWFDDAANVELMVKLLDFGDHVLAFYGQLTNLQIVLQVVDLESGEVRTYRNGRHNCGAIDEHAFSDHDHGDGADDAIAGDIGKGIRAGARLQPPPRRRRSSGASHLAGSCVADGDTLCLLAGRIAVDLSWRNQFAGTSGHGLAGAVSDLTGSFAFDDPRNVELLVKALDFGDRVLILWGALSNLEYQLSVTDSIGGESKVYTNPAGTYCGGLDERAFTSP
jgi:choice-of-anchor B domain-containing protein